jgi:iron complex outermembrane receptor protein
MELSSIRRRSRLCRGWIAYALGAAVLPAPLFAQERPEPAGADTARADSVAIALEGLVVRVGRPTATAGGASALEVRLDSMRVGPAPTLDQVLRAMPLVQVRANSRGEMQLSLRGAESRQVAVLLDGVPLTLGWDHRTDLSIVPVAAAQAVTLHRGLPSVLHGPNVLGGVVEVGVARGEGGPLELVTPASLQGSLGIDHLGARALAATAARPVEVGAGSLLVRGGIGYRERGGVAVPGEIESTAGDGDGRRLNSDLRQFDGFLALRYRSARGAWLSAASSGYHAERGVPPEMHTAEPRFWRYPEASRIVAAISGGTGQRATPWGEGDLEASIGIDLGRTEIESYDGPFFTTIDGTEDADDRTLTFRLLGDHTLGERGELRAAATFADVRHDEVLDGGAPMAYRQRIWSVGGEVAWRLAPAAAGGWLSATRLTAGIAYDGADTPETGDKPPLDRLGAWGGRVGIHSVVADGAVMLHAGVSRRARFPSLRELYSGALGRFAPNPSLRPEELVAAEAGATARVGRVELQAVGFHQRLSDVIVRASTGDGRFRRENRDEMRSTGIEILTGWPLGPTGVVADLTLQRVRLLDPTASGGTRRPEYQPSVAGRLDWTVPLPLGARADAGVVYTGRQWCVHPDLDTDVAIDPTTRVDLGLGRSWRRVDATLAVDNVADGAIYDQCGLPQPGRTLRFQLRLR